VIATLLKLVLLFGVLSLLAVGGGNAVIPAMQHRVVDVEGWMTNRQFLDLFAISRLAPGPGSLIVTLVGQKAAGIVGAIVATVAMYLPSCVVVHVAARVWHRYRDAGWRATLEQALAPVAVGLVVASALALMRSTEHGPGLILLTLVSTIVLALTELPPLLVLAGGGVAGFLLHL
jgi:chromate transporter